MAALHQNPGPGREVPVRLDTEQVHHDALAGARPCGKGEVRSQAGRSASRMHKPARRGELCQHGSKDLA